MKKTLSPKIQGFLRKDNPLTSKTVSKKKAKAVFDEGILFNKTKF
jgi:hypothetical protein